MAGRVHAIGGNRSLGERLDACRGIGPGFDTLRLFAAVVVLLSHAFPLTRSAEPLGVLLSGQASGGSLGVAIFFIISGFLIAASFERSRSVAEFGIKRALRIMPGLICVVVLTVCVLGAMLTTLEPNRYATDSETFRYLLNIVFKNETALPGVFQSNPLNDVNGSLWTLKYEVLCYAALVIVLSIGFRPAVTVGLLLAVAAMSVLGEYAGAFDAIEGGSEGLLRTLVHNLRNMFGLFAFFAVGMVFYLLRFRCPWSGTWAAIAALGLAVASAFNHLAVVMPFLLGYVVIYLGLSDLSIAQRLTGGDYSYGVYVWAFPIQQATIDLIHPASWWMNIAIALPVTLLVAAASWHWLEKPALELRRTLRQALGRSVEEKHVER